MTSYCRPELQTLYGLRQVLIPVTFHPARELFFEPNLQTSTLQNQTPRKHCAVGLYKSDGLPQLQNRIMSHAWKKCLASKFLRSDIHNYQTRVPRLTCTLLAISTVAWLAHTFPGRSTGGGLVAAGHASGATVTSCAKYIVEMKSTFDDRVTAK